ncbi:MAG: pyruvate:ferredoxin (flavodoxin) oxidoreductase [Clostridia bacterium]|nr:pyruvate:ferredoxin (flavodoxin) oxidoreductase [Clostridia bacterium]
MLERKQKTMDGNTAAAHVSYAFSEVASIYPITPSSTMAEEVDKMATAGVKNVFGRKVEVSEMQSEGGAAGAMHGTLQAGALATTYTASQGLLLMIPNMYKMAGELLPGVFHVSARSLATHALNIFGDHSDIYAARQTGFAMLASGNPQEVMDLGAVAHLAAIRGRVPFLHFFDGFRTSHEIQKIKIWDYEDLGKMIDKKALQEFKDRALTPENPVLRGSAQNPDVFFQAREACNPYYDKIVGVVEDYMKNINEKIGTDYQLFNYYGASDAEYVIIAMGSVCDTIEETIDNLNAKGEKYGLIKVRLYRPFSKEHLLSALPSTVKAISVLDRTKEPGALGEPLYLDVVASLKDSKFKDLPVYGGRYGLGSKDTPPVSVKAVYDNMKSENPKEEFTMSINDDITNLSLSENGSLNTTPEGTKSCKFWGIGSDGTVGANKNSIKIIGDNTDLFVQGYFSYDSKKSGGITVSHLRFGKSPIKSTYLIKHADFVACHNPSYLYNYDMTSDLKENGDFLLNCIWNEDELEKHLPANVKRDLANKNISFYIINGTKTAEELGLGNRINTILQSAFFSIANIIPIEEARSHMKAAAKKSYGKKGDKIVQMNYDAIDKGIENVKKVNVPKEWANAQDEDTTKEIKTDRPEIKRFIKDVLDLSNKQRGDEIPVSAFAGEYADGTIPQGTAAFEKRGTAVHVPEWNPDNCIQCNFCSYVCPHAVIRPAVLNKEEAENRPEGMKTMPMNGVEDMEFAITVSPMDCLSCGSCANVCPGKKGQKALTMETFASQKDKQKEFDYAQTLSCKPQVKDKFKNTTVKGSQFNKPLLEFSGACAGCGETPYAKLITQLFGDKMLIANATGCSSIWGSSSPSTPYTVNAKGKGPAWANSLFEDNAEYGYGMFLANKAVRGRLLDNVQKLTQCDDISETLKSACESWIQTYDDTEKNALVSEILIEELEKFNSDSAYCSDLIKDLLNNKNFISKKSFWIFGGDGWAYDIGFGGLDHVLAKNEDVNIFVFDTEVYSNTGGQASKATNMGAIAKFDSSGKEIKKKDLASMAMTYGYVYVAQISMGADYNQCLKAIKEAENYKGPSIIIAYSPCINHGIKGGLGLSISEEKKAVEAGYWHNFRFNPDLKKEGKNPLIIDSKAPTSNYTDFLMNEVRYSSLKRFFPDKADNLFEKAEKIAADRYTYLKKLEKMLDSEE